MGSFHIKSLILGIGIGIILTSIVGIVYSSGYKPELSKDEIIVLAKKIGMVEGTQILKDKTVKIETTSASPTQAVAQITVKPTLAPIEKQEVSVSIKTGDTSETVAKKLVELNIIKDKQAFINEINSQKRSERIEIGEYKINKGEEISNIVKMLTK